MSKTDQLVRNWRKKSFWTNAVIPYLGRLPQTAVFNLYSRFVHGTPVDVVDEDWDNLIILDACRYDSFSKTNWLDGSLESKISKACVTGNFLRMNFPDEYPEIVYVTANPHAPKIVSDRFHQLIPVSKTDWDEERGTVMPDVMTEAVRDAAERYPNKRIVAHYLQPHSPYVGSKTLERYGSRAKVQDMFRDGEITRQEMLNIYTENLEFVLGCVESLQNDIIGKTVITADHGEMFKDVARPFRKRVVGHWPRMRTTELVKVPWFTLPFDNRREITAGAINTASTQSDEERDEKLRALGYLQ